MRVLYQLPIIPPEMPAGEALSQEISALQARFDGGLIYLNPNQYSPVYIPRLLFGFHKLRQIRQQETGVQLHHFYNPDPFPFPILRWYRRPVIYTISSGVGEKRPNIPYFSSLSGIVVYDERSLERLKSWGLENCYLVRSGVDVTRFSYSPLAVGKDIILMVGSAPWTKTQFDTKGINALLTAASQWLRLKLVFLWRGVLFEEMQKLVQEMGLENQVTVLNEQVDVNRVLAGVHASITLVTDAAIIKAYPHSLIDSLAAGKPVIVSRTIPMADYVERTKSGIVVESLTTANLQTAVDNLIQHYTDLQKNAEIVGQRDFSQQAMVESYENVYRQILRGKQP